MNEIEDSAVRQILDMNAFDETCGSDDPNVARRLQNLGAASVLFFRKPIEMRAARGATLIAADGTKYLDFYNNVPSVGHCHPKVVEAVSKQIAQINTHTRYLIPIVDDYIESLKAKLPPHLTNIVLSCSGSEANDLALRIARRVTGAEGFIVTEAAYHGNTSLCTDVSPSAFKTGELPPHVVTIPAPSSDLYGSDIASGVVASIETAIKELEQRGMKPAAFIADSIFSSDGIFADPSGFLKPAIECIKKAGGLYIADEVQPGFARTGTHFWGFERHGVSPDFVTMGKPMGNGFPMAGMAVSPDHLKAFCDDFGYFNTFGGNPVAAAAGLAVLQIIDEEGLQDNAAAVGQYLKNGIEEAACNSARVSAVRGAGLFIGVDLIANEDDPRPDPEFTVKLIDAMRDRGILIGAAGRFGATLKIRPPLCLTTFEADKFLQAFSASLTVN